ncbi:MAG: hypothetical protein DRO88_12320 [Promethearchaeia archaeon]|nr:MAG: hypothetical protein DRO88_12320 [Candidatus Lokiarchaeia archaeon]
MKKLIVLINFSKYRMPVIRTKNYTVKPSDSREWIIIQSPSGTSVDVELRIMNYHYDCQPKLIDINGEKIYCSQLCCYAGCYVSKKEIKKVEKILPKIKQYLQKDSIDLLEKVNDQIYVPSDYDKEEKLYKTRTAPEEWEFSDDEEEETDEETEENKSNKDIEEGKEREIEENEEEIEIPKNHCIFLTEKGLCATHQYYNENNIDWVKEKFNICVTFPLDIRPQDKTLAFMDEFDSFAYHEVDCISKDEDMKIKLGMPQIIDSMKYAIVDRYNLEWWEALSAFSKDYRAGKIDLDYIYREFD